MRTKRIQKILFAGCFVLAAFASFAAFNQKGFFNYDDKHTNQADSLEWGVPTGDDPLLELQKLVKRHYGEHMGMRHSGLIKLIDVNEDHDKVLEEKTFAYEVANGEFDYTIDSMEMISKKELLLTVDHREKTLAISAAVDAGKSPQFDIKIFEEMARRENIRSLVGAKDGVKILTVDSIQHPSIQAYHIFYDPVNYDIKKIIVEMVRFSPLDGDPDHIDLNSSSDKNSEEAITAYIYLMEIDYNDSKTFEIETEYKPELKFFRYTGNENEPVILQPAFRTYELINQVSE